MQDTFLSLTAMRIHISETTHSELLKAGIYHMSKRGEVEMKVNMYNETVCRRLISMFQFLK